MVIRALALCVLMGVATCPRHVSAAQPEDEGGAEALILATGFGLYQGIALTFLLDEYDIVDTGIISGAWITLFSTGGSFLLASHVIETHGVNAVQASLFNSSLLWGVLNTSAGVISADLDRSDMVLSGLVSGWLGQGLGVLLAANVDQTAGQVALMNTTGLWAGAEALLLMSLFSLDLGDHYVLVSTGVADAGLLVGSYLANTYRISQTRARYLDLGALVGGLAAPAALFMVYGPETHERKWYLSAVAVGIPLGIAAAWHFTRDLDNPESLPAPANLEPLVVPLLSGVF